MVFKHNPITNKLDISGKKVDLSDYADYYYYETDSASVTYYYFGYLQVGGNGWRIRRVHKTDYSVGWAVGDTDYATNWSNRTSLTYNPTL